MEAKTMTQQRLYTRLLIGILAFFLLLVVAMPEQVSSYISFFLYMFWGAPLFWLVALFVGWIAGLLVSGVLLFLRKKGFSISRLAYWLIYFSTFLLTAGQALLMLMFIEEGYVNLSVNFLMLFVVALAATLSAALILRYYART